MKLFSVYGVKREGQEPVILMRIEAESLVETEVILDNKKPNLHMGYSDYWICEVI